MLKCWRKVFINTLFVPLAHCCGVGSQRVWHKIPSAPSPLLSKLGVSFIALLFSDKFAVVEEKYKQNLLRTLFSRGSMKRPLASCWSCTPSRSSGRCSDNAHCPQEREEISPPVTAGPQSRCCVALSSSLWRTEIQLSQVAAPACMQEGSEGVGMVHRAGRTWNWLVHLNNGCL